MRPATASNSSSSALGDGGFRRLRSPIPYLFGGLTLILALIAVSLLVLACSYRKQSSSSTSASGDGEKPTCKTTADSEPKILVIMAGDSNPTYLAKPISSTSHAEQAI